MILLIAVDCWMLELVEVALRARIDVQLLRLLYERVELDDKTDVMTAT